MLVDEEEWILLQKFANDEEWCKVLKILHRYPNCLYQKLTSSSPYISELTLFAYFIGLDAPPQLLSYLLWRDSKQIKYVDKFGGNVCHIACLNGVNLKTFCWIVSRCPSLINERDLDGNLPIHHVPVYLQRDKRDVDQAIQIMKVMIDINPEILLTQCYKGNTVVDLVELQIMSRSHAEEDRRHELMTLGKYLRDQSIQFWLRKKKIWEEEGPQLKNI